tara:strand:- start:172 stop:1476 length:1305 start_codon:yes stop_codon:yes gene_type:complete
MNKKSPAKKKAVPVPKGHWTNIGKRHLWPPYTQSSIAPEPLAVSGTKGCEIILDDGRKLVDGVASWWTACHGYNHPHIIQAMHKQLDVMPHVMIAGNLHQPAALLCKRLADMTKMDKVFLTDSGSTAVETALKIAVQYWRNKGIKHRSKFVTFENAYHGDTMGCMSLCDPEKGMHKLFHEYMPRQYSMKLPSGEYGFAEFEALLEQLKHTIAGVIIEPLVQGAGGLKFHSSDVVAEIHRLCKEHDVLFIADEVMTGFGRTGHMFACNEAGIIPDIMCVGKALTGGTMTMAATIATQEIYEAFDSQTLEDALMSGPTYMANPLACAAANASLDLFEQESRLEQVANIETYLYDALSSLKVHKRVADVRVKGAIGVVQLHDASWQDIVSMRTKAVEHGCWLRPFGDVLYVMPAFTITEKELKKLTDTMVSLIETLD